MSRQLRSKINGKYFDLIPKITESKAEQIRFKIVDLTRRRNELIQERIKILEETREKRKRLFEIAYKIQDFDAIINKELAGLPEK